MTVRAQYAKEKNSVLDKGLQMVREQCSAGRATTYVRTCTYVQLVEYVRTYVCNFREQNQRTYVLTYVRLLVCCWLIWGQIAQCNGQRRFGVKITPLSTLKLRRSKHKLMLQVRTPLSTLKLSTYVRFLRFFPNDCASSMVPRPKPWPKPNKVSLQSYVGTSV